MVFSFRLLHNPGGRQFTGTEVFEQEKNKPNSQFLQELCTIYRQNLQGQSTPFASSQVL